MRERAERILLTLWVGGMWSIGYIVAPTLFAALSKTVAGTVAGHLFTIMSYVGLVCGGLLLLSQLADDRLVIFQRWRSLVIIGMLLIICIGQFVLTPRMDRLKDAGLSGVNFHAFMRLHGVAQILFLFASLGGLALVFFGHRTPRSN